MHMMQGLVALLRSRQTVHLTQLSPEAFAMLTDGVDLHGAKLRPWYERE
jgi:hypothetical protein